MFKVFRPSLPDHYTIYRPYRSSAHTMEWWRRWGIAVVCHPEARRDPLVVLLWLGVLWLSVLVGGTWLLWQKGELRPQYANWLRLLVLLVAPLLGWVGFGVPVVQVVISTGFAFLAGLLGALRERGAWADPRMVVGRAVELARGTWLETTSLACGHVESLPLQPDYAAQQEERTGSEKEGHVRETADAKEEQKPPETGLQDEEKRLLASDGADGSDGAVPLLEICVRTDSAPAPITTQCLQFAAAIPLGYLSIVTLLLCQRRLNIYANAIVDDILWHVALTGLSICAQMVIIACRGGTAPIEQSSGEQLVVPIDSAPPVEEDSSQAKDSTASPKPTTSLILYARFAGLMHGVNVNTKDAAKSTIMALGRVGPLECLASTVYFAQFLVPRLGNKDYAHLGTLCNIESMTLLLGALPGLWLIPLAFIAITLRIVHKLFSRIFSESRAVEFVEGLRSRMVDLVAWVRAPYARVPETLRLLLERGYWPIWMLCIYGAVYGIVAQEIMRFDTRMWPRATNRYCLDLWRDPLAERLLWPFFSAVDEINTLLASSAQLTRPFDAAFTSTHYLR